MDNQRATARQLAADAIKNGRPLDWFEELYSKAKSKEALIPWADLAPNPNLIQLFETQKNILKPNISVLKVGCGLGDDAEWLSEQQFKVTAFDISKSAISECLNRFPNSNVQYFTANLFEAPKEWIGAFDLVVEAYTLQVLPNNLRKDALSKIAQFTTINGYLFIVCRLRETSDDEGAMPWPLTRNEIDELKLLGFDEIYAEDYLDAETPAVRRFRGIYKRRK